MRPLRISVEGFAAFREPAELDLVDVELFALVGPTGAGKSTLIDAMVFALYGSVPRYDSENLVHPVITQGALEARVRLDFTVGGRDYTAVRVVRRTKTGATTKEARLESGDDVLADDAKALTAAVVDLLGLDLEQFTKCVVLPQGAFATLLHDTKAKRQDLLVKLLDLGVYERIASAARAECRSIGFRVESLDEQLGHLAHATDEAVATATRRVSEVGTVVEALDDANPELTSIEDEIRAADAELSADMEALDLLAGVVAPDGIDEIANLAVEAGANVEAAEVAEQATSAAATTARAARDALPAEADLRRVLADHAALTELEGKVATGRALLAELEERRPELAAAVTAAADELAAATAALERARVEHGAADLARHLHPGDDCPVCGNEVVALPDVDDRALATAERDVATAAAAERQAAAALADHDQQLADYRARLDVRTTERDHTAERLAGAPTAAESEQQLAARAEADRALAAARAADDVARQEAASARAAAQQADRRLGAARSDFHAARDRVALLGPPPPAGDLGADWKTLVGWAEAASEERGARTTEVRARRVAAERRRDERIAELRSRAEVAGVDLGAVGPGIGALRDACVTEAATARTRLEHLVSDRDRAADLRAERATLDERRQVHDLLAEQLGARGFEAWLLDEALDLLLDGASRWLEQLSSGRYAITVDEKNQFAVIDHANADERRLARTLSGGETFLASLALALALAEQVGELSAGGGRSLEAIFLDEGFGTLDPDTLDVVATAIEELGATGRMVGVISHVPELAERVPVRYEITKAPRTSTVRRMEA